jgi:D-arabinose 1-dehydrogenase-like Zn-dependent alcohol dehydrogenase
MGSLTDQHVSNRGFANREFERLLYSNLCTLARASPAMSAVVVGVPNLILHRQRLMGSSSGSRKELQATLDLAAVHGIRPRVNCFPLERASKALTKLQTVRSAGRFALVIDLSHTSRPRAKL